MTEYVVALMVFIAGQWAPITVSVDEKPVSFPTMIQCRTFAAHVAVTAIRAPGVEGVSVVCHELRPI